MTITATLSSQKGLRDYQEDRVYFNPQILKRYSVAAVFDGHVGDQASEYMKNNITRVITKEIQESKSMYSALYNTIKRLEYGFSGEGYKTTNSNAYKKKLEKLPDIAGTTCVIAVIDSKDHKLYIANVGDSRALLVRQNDKKHSVYQITQDHNMDVIGSNNLNKFKKDSSAYVSSGYLWTKISDKGQHGLNVTRTLGDPLFKGRFNPLIIESDEVYDIIPWQPDIFCYVLKTNDLIILGSDGIYNFLSNSDVARAALKGGADEVTSQALKNHSTDNVSSIVVNV